MAASEKVTVTPRRARSELSRRFLRNGYVRRPDATRRKSEPEGYKKGYEIRLVADSTAELREIRRLLRVAGFEPGRPFTKANQWRQPVYGREAVTRFLDFVNVPRAAAARRKRSRAI